LSEQETILRMEGISKAFPGVQALRDVDFEAHAGQVVALVGENGAGKSTLMKILSGVYRKDAGASTFRDGRWRYRTRTTPNSWASPSSIRNST